MNRAKAESWAATIVFLTLLSILISLMLIWLPPVLID
jgi:hypothetical protein